MKVMPKQDLIALLQLSDKEYITEGLINVLFDTYGDDYYINRDNGEYECCKKNEGRYIVLKER